VAERKTGERDHEQPGVARRDFLKTVAGVTLLGGSSALARVASAEDVPPEPEDLDEPTPWQEGDPEPVEMTVPAVEPEQTSPEAPPSQPMDDERPPQPTDPEHAWVIGYWWWTNGAYVWVPGYWAPPPQPGYVYVAGYWKGNTWVYVRGGWAQPNTTVIVAQPQPRPVVTALVITAPSPPQTRSPQSSPPRSPQEAWQSWRTWRTWRTWQSRRTWQSWRTRWTSQEVGG